MSKVILIFINIIGFLIFTIFNINDIVITHVAPSEISLNQETEVKIIIDKNSFSGPGRLRLDFSECLDIDVKEKVSDGASFTFKDNEVLFIWYDLPSEKNIEISYIITANESATGMKKIKGDFSFINDNERKQLEIPDLIFKINSDLVIDEIVEEKKSTVETFRTIEKSGDNFIVTISTKIENHKGFARIKEELPTNVNASAIQTAGAIFKNVDGFAKFIWTEIPDTIKEITVKYMLNNMIKSDSSFSIVGVYSSEKLISEGYNTGIIIKETIYTPTEKNNEILTLENENISETNNVEIKEISNEENEVVKQEDNQIKEDTLSDEKNQIKEELASNTISKDNQKIEVGKSKKDTVYEIIEEEKIVNKAANKQNQNVVTSQKINNNIDYKVQILAAHRIINSSYLSKKFDYKGVYEIESHMGWIKYTIGNYSEYKKARDTRNEIKKHEFPGPFVSAYNYGERISVQEALILSKENWIP